MTDQPNMEAFEAETRKHQQRVAHFLIDMAWSLLIRADKHDDSKLEKPEARAFAEATPMLSQVDYTDEEAYQESLDLLGDALDHHYAHNDHHPEHHQDSIKGMTLLQLLEMLADWTAAVERHDDGNDVFDSLEKNAAEYGISPQLKDVLENTLRTIKCRDFTPVQVSRGSEDDDLVLE